MSLYWFYLCFVNVEFRPFGVTFQRNVMLLHFDSERDFKAKVALGEHNCDPRLGFKANVAIDSSLGSAGLDSAGPARVV